MRASRFQYDTVFSSIYSQLNTEKKKYFLNALLTKNVQMLSEVINSLDLDGPFKSFLARTKAKYFTVKEVLHPALLGAIQKALSTEKAETLLPVLFDVFQSIPETHVSASVKGIIDMRSKKKLLPELLLLASKPVREKVISQLTDLSYDPALSSLRPAIGDSAYVKSGITLQEYRQLAAKGRIDISEFLVLTIGLFDKCKLKLRERSSKYPLPSLCCFGIIQPNVPG